MQPALLKRFTSVYKLWPVFSFGLSVNKCPAVRACHTAVCNHRGLLCHSTVLQGSYNYCQIQSSRRNKMSGADVYTETEDLRADIDAREKHKVKLLNEHKFQEAVDEVYTEDVIMYPSGSEPVSGRAANLARLQFSYNNTAMVKMESTTDKAEYLGNDTAAVIVSFWGKDKDDQITSRSRALSIWKNVEGKWCIYRAMIQAPPEN